MTSNKKGLAILMRTKMRPPIPSTGKMNQMQINPQENSDEVSSILNAFGSCQREFEQVRESMHSAISMNKTEILDAALCGFSQGYFSFSEEHRRKLLVALAREYDLDRTQVRELMKQYLGLELPDEVLWDDPPIPESEATCALFYSISSTQPGLSGINLGKFLIKRVIDVVKKDMPSILTIATLSPIPGYMQWLLSKLASAEKSGSTFGEKLLKPEEEKALLDATREFISGKNDMEVMQTLLTSTDYEWTNSDTLVSVLRTPLMRLCARHLLQEKKRGRALDSVANFHLQNGAMIGRLNWMADRSQKGLTQSGGIMVNYIYRVENIEENAQSYYSEGKIQATSDVSGFLEDNEEARD